MVSNSRGKKTPRGATRFSLPENHARGNIHRLPQSISLVRMYPEVSSFGVSASFFSHPIETPIARNVVSRERERERSFPFLFSLPFSIRVRVAGVYTYIYTRCIYLREETIHTPAFHSRKFTYTYPVGYPYHPLPQRGFVPRSIWGVGTSREDEVEGGGRGRA